MTDALIGSVWCNGCQQFVSDASCGHGISTPVTVFGMPEVVRLRNARLTLADAMREFEEALKAYARAGGE
jgi:hypothetical protein